MRPDLPADIKKYVEEGEDRIVEYVPVDEEQDKQDTAADNIADESGEE